MSADAGILRRCFSLAIGPARLHSSFGIMNRIAIDSHRSLFYTLFAIFEALLLAAVVVLWLIDPRRMSGVDDAAGVTIGFSLVGLSIVSWLLRRAAPRLARVGWVSIVAAFLACSLLPAIP